MPPGINGDCSPGVVAAMDAGDTATVRDLVRRGAVAACEATSQRLENAVLEGRLDRLEILLEAGANPNWGVAEFRSRPDLVALALNRHKGSLGLGLARALLSHGASPDRRIAYQTAWTTRRADDSGEPYQVYDVQKFNVTLLMLAAMEGNRDVTRLLLEFNADPLARDSSARSALDYARERTDDEIVTRLIEAERTGRSAPR